MEGLQFELGGTTVAPPRVNPPTFEQVQQQLAESFQEILAQSSGWQNPNLWPNASLEQRKSVIATVRRCFQLRADQGATAPLAFANDLLDDESISRLCEVSSVLEIEPRKIVLEAGEDVDHVWWILRGACPPAVDGLCLTLVLQVL